MTTLRCFLQLGILMSVFDCAPTSSSAVVAPSIGEPFSLAVGESASVKGANLSLTFTAVTQDSRCPKDANCIVAGEAIVVLEALSGDARTDLSFKVPPDGGDAKGLEELTITITELDPQTESGKRIEPASYVAKVVVAAGP